MIFYFSIQVHFVNTSAWVPHLLFVKVKVKSSMARSLPVENLLPQNVGQLSTTFSNVLKQPNGELLVAVNHNQLRTMASETVDPIGWSHPPPSWAVPPERHVHSINQCNLSMRGNHLAYAATQGISNGSLNQIWFSVATQGISNGSLNQIWFSVTLWISIFCNSCPCLWPRWRNKIYLISFCLLIAILNGASFSLSLVQEKLNMPSGHY